MWSEIDAFTSPTLKHLRESWWNDEFTEFLRETLKPRPGNRILDVGCGEGLAEVAIGRLHISQVKLFGVDLVVSKVLDARRQTSAHNQRVGFAAADACRLPFVNGSFDSLYCVAVLQHIGDVPAALAEFARVIVPSGRIVAVEPDNGARYVYSSVASGQAAFALASRLFSADAAARGETTDSTIGPRLPGALAEHGIEPVAVRLFPVTQVSLGPLPAAAWASRRRAAESAVAQAASGEVRQLAHEYAAAIEAYQSDAAVQGQKFFEIQNTMLFATVGQKA